MAPSPEILAVVFDFDDTLAPDSTTRLLESYGYDTDTFWKKDVRAMVAQGYDPTLAWLNLVLADVRAGGTLAGLSNRALREFGASLDDTFFPGIPEILPRLRESVSKFRDIAIEFYGSRAGSGRSCLEARSSESTSPRYTHASLVRTRMVFCETSRGASHLPKRPAISLRLTRDFRSARPQRIRSSSTPMCPRIFAASRSRT